MKRSKHIKLTLLMGATGSLAGCGDSEESALLFQDTNECNSFGIELETCQAEYQQALEQHLNEAPRYATEQLCEGDFGFDRCESNGGIWQPLMAGFMIGLVAEAVDEGLDALKKKRKHKRAMLGGKYYSGAKPLYRSRDDFFSYRNSNNDYVASASSSGSTLVKSSKVNYKAKRKPVTRKRGGFGRSASRSSWGG
tara:strand:- start:930 stop:1514 length:585 start_codon:yes stop_codon:yes gene_type:complete